MNFGCQNMVGSIRRVLMKHPRNAYQNQSVLNQQYSQLNYPEVPSKEDRERYKQYFINLGEMLPCKYCRESYKIYLKYMPLDNFLNSREGLSYWFYRMHNFKVTKYM